MKEETREKSLWLGISFYVKLTSAFFVRLSLGVVVALPLGPRVSPVCCMIYPRATPLRCAACSLHRFRGGWAPAADATCL